jgi:hypothetical protein
VARFPAVDRLPGLRLPDWFQTLAFAVLVALGAKGLSVAPAMLAVTRTTRITQQSPEPPHHEVLHLHPTRDAEAFMHGTRFVVCQQPQHKQRPDPLLGTSGRGTAF